MAKNISIAALVILAAFLASVIIRLENENYAMQVGLCKPADFKCLSTVQTRTSPLWHLFYAVTN